MNSSKSIVKEILADTPIKKPAMRWWIPITCDTEELCREVELAAAGGFGLLEICLSTADSSVTPEFAAENGWGTKVWNDKYKAILRTANRVGIRIDTTISPMYPPGVPTITKADPEASKEIRICSTEPFSGTYIGRLPARTENPRTGFVGEVNKREFCDFLAFSQDNGLHEDSTLVAALAVKVKGEAPVTRLQGASWGDDVPNFNEKTRITTLLGESILIDPACINDHDISWTAPDDGEWKIFAAWMQGTGQECGRGGISWAPCLVVDHLNPDGVKVLTEFWESNLLDDELCALIRENGSSVFEDSIELHVTRHHNLWTANFLEEFKKRRGYDFTPYLPLLAGMNHRGDSIGDLFMYELYGDEGYVTADRIRNDFRQTMNDLLLEYHTIPIREWLHSKGYHYRAQMYSAILDTGIASSMIDEPEGESIGFGWGVHAEDRFRLVAGGAHMGLRQQISDEAGAVFGEGYRQTWLDFLVIANRGFAGGANLMMLHGMPYRNSTLCVWPGMHPFGISCAGSWGDREPGWKHITDLSGYLTKVQTLLSAGCPRVDVGLFQYYYGTSAPFLGDQSMMKAGYSYDILTPALLKLPSAVYECGRLCPDGAGYRALVLNKQKYMPVDAMQQLYALACEGMPVVFVGRTPYLAAYHTENSDCIVELSQKMLALSNVRLVEHAAALPEALKALGITPAAAFETPAQVHATCREVNGKRLYHLWNAGDAAVETRITFEGNGALLRYDPWTDTEVWISDGAGAVPVQLLPGEATVLLRAGIDHAAAEVGAYTEMELPHWSLDVERWTNYGDPAHPWLTRKEHIAVAPHVPAGWSALSEIGDQVSGIGLYHSTMTLAQPVDHAVMTLPVRDFHGLQVTVNGTSCPVNYYTREAFIPGDALTVGSNAVIVELSTPLFNALDASGAFAMPGFGPPPPMEEVPMGEGAPLPEEPSGDDFPGGMFDPKARQEYGLLSAVKIRLYQ